MAQRCWRSPNAQMLAGTVYNYFKSKDELAIAVLEEMMSNIKKMPFLSTSKEISI